MSGDLSRPDLPGPRLLVRCLGRRLGCSPGSRHGFRPLVFRRGMHFHQLPGAFGSGEGSPPLPVFSGGVHCGHLCGQLNGGGVPSEVGGYPLSSPQRDNSENPPVVGASPYHSRPTVHPRLPQCPRGLSVSSSPDPGLRVDPSRGRVSGLLPSVAGDGRFVCHLSKSPLFCLFLSLPASSVCRDGRVSTVMGRSSRLRIPSFVRHSPDPGEASRFSGDLSDSGNSVLASAPVVSRAPGSGGCSSGSAAVLPESSVPTKVGSPLSGSPQASASCLETLRRFTRAAGFSSGVASQVGLARRSSSRTNYQLKWSTYRSWCRAKGHSISRPSFSKVADFLLWLRRHKGLSVSSVMGYRSMLSAVFRFQLPGLSSQPVLRDLRSFRLEAPSCPLRPSAWDLAAVLTFLNSAVFEPLQLASLRNLTKKVLFLLALATAKRVGELQALSRSVSFVRIDACLSYVPEFVAKTESLSNPIRRSFLVRSLSDFSAGLDEELLLCPVCALRIYLDRMALFSPLPRRLFVSPCRPSRALSKNAVSFLREVIHEAEAGRPEVGPVCAHSIRGCPPRLLFTGIGWLPACWSLLHGAPIRCLYHFIYLTFNTNLRVSVLWVRSWLRVLGSRNPHLFPLCAGGGGGTMSPLFLPSSRLYLCYRFMLRACPSYPCGCG